MHEAEFDHTHISDEARQEMARFIWSQESLELTTVGIDIGSSTSHLLFAKVLMQRRAQALSSRFIAVEREVLWRSPIVLTPFLADGTIDAAALDEFIRECYAAAGFARSGIDSGAVILTGEAIKRKNAKAVDELFAGEAGKFVCATAGHRLEAMLAAHGSGAVRLSETQGRCLLHVDIGGGTTKMALIDRGKIVSVAAFAAGGRLIAQDAAGAWTRIEDSARAVAAELAIEATPESFAAKSTRRALARRLAAIIAANVAGAPPDRLAAALQLTAPLQRAIAPAAVSISGGVSEYLFGREKRDFGDIAKDLAEELQAAFAAQLKMPVLDPGEGIHATVIGASQFTVQVSGKTIYLPDMSVLPVHNIPVVHVELDTPGAGHGELQTRIEAAMTRLDLLPDAAMAIAFAWNQAPEYANLAAAARAVAAAAQAERRKNLLLLMIDGDVGKSLGHILADELGFSAPLVSIDGVALRELDFVDVGVYTDPPGVVPVVIKSLLFS